MAFITGHLTSVQVALRIFSRRKLFFSPEDERERKRKKENLSEIKALSLGPSTVFFFNINNNLHLILLEKEKKCQENGKKKICYFYFPSRNSILSNFLYFTSTAELLLLYKVFAPFLMYHIQQCRLILSRQENRKNVHTSLPLCIICLSWHLVHLDANSLKLPVKFTSCLSKCENVKEKKSLWHILPSFIYFFLASFYLSLIKVKLT